MPKRAPAKKNINAWLDEYVRDRIATGAKRAGITKTEFLRQAILAYAEHIDNQHKEQPHEEKRNDTAED